MHKRAGPEVERGAAYEARKKGSLRKCGGLQAVAVYSVEDPSTVLFKYSLNFN